jgi:glucose/arabinose dehydrogenase
MRIIHVLAVAAATTLGLGLLAAPAGGGPVPRGAASVAPAVAAEREAAVRAAGPRIRVRVVKRGLDHPWDLTFLPGGGMLYTQRDRLSIRHRSPSGRDRVVRFREGRMWHSGEAGLMSILATRGFEKTRNFYTCHANAADRPSGHDVRVVLWRLASDARRASRVRTIVAGLPTVSGRHSGCRLRYGPEGALYIGTGDAARTGVSQNLASGGGKVLRVRPGTGKPWPGNPFLEAGKAMKRRVYTYGHRNVQGLAVRPGSGMWAVEQGTYRDDEVNRLRAGGNYGWQAGPGYDESRPMTDFSLPGRQIGARWASGNPTIATSGATFLRGKRWGVWQGALAVGVLKDSQIRILAFDEAGRFVRAWTPAKLNTGYRMRSPVQGPDGNLYITTDNGGGSDRILKVVPQG